MSEEVKQESKSEIKEAKFKANPERFIDLDDVVIMLLRTTGGPAVMISPNTRQEMIQAKGELEVAMIKQILLFDDRIDKARKDAIQPVKGGIINFMRGKR